MLLQQFLALEALQRLAQRRARDAEPLGKVLLDDRIAAPELALADHARQRVIGLLRKVAGRWRAVAFQMSRLLVAERHPWSVPKGWDSDAARLDGRFIDEYIRRRSRRYRKPAPKGRLPGDAPPGPDKVRAA